MGVEEGREGQRREGVEGRGKWPGGWRGAGVLEAREMERSGNEERRMSLKKIGEDSGDERNGAGGRD